MFDIFKADSGAETKEEKKGVLKTRLQRLPQEGKEIYLICKHSSENRNLFSQSCEHTGSKVALASL